MALRSMLVIRQDGTTVRVLSEDNGRSFLVKARFADRDIRLPKIERFDDGTEAVLRAYAIVEKRASLALSRECNHLPLENS